MPFVIIRYGPYLAYGLIEHRIQKINGLFVCLDSLGYEIELVPINEYNRLSIEMYDREVFRCDIRNLMFNMSCEDDPVCQRAVNAVQEASYRMCNEENIARYSSIFKGERDILEQNTDQSVGVLLPSGTELLHEHFSPGGRHTSKHRELEEKSDKLKLEEKTAKVRLDDMSQLMD